MLVLRRKSGEAIVLNNVIRIIILSVDRYRVKIGIEAPPDVVIVREELLYEPAESQASLSSQAAVGVEDEEV